MRSIELKSIGTLIDEKITAELKVIAGNKEASSRVLELTIALYDRLTQMSSIPDYSRIENRLRDMLKACWDAQERVMLEEDPILVAQAAKLAQLTNKKRNEYIREIDDLFKESKITPLEKTYG